MPRTGPGDDAGSPPRTRRPKVTEPPEIMNVVEAAAFLHVAPATVRTALAAQRLPGKRIGKEWRLSRSALLEWLSEPGEAKNYPRRRPMRKV
jgi:excisionase family DNA binding protein